MITKKLTVQNEHGIHSRVALKVVETCRRCSSTITISNGCELANGCSVLELLMLGAEKGAAIEIIASGGLERESADEIAQIFSQGSGI